mgnify:CR=1 FL=1
MEAIMKRWLRALFAATALCGAAGALALQVVDDRGVVVQFERSPQRIVSVLPSLTETVCALGQCQRLVGVDRYSNFPDSVRNLPQVGGGIDPNIEAIVALKPDVVLMATSARGAERLQSMGIKVLALEPMSHADVRRVLSDYDFMLCVGAVPDAHVALSASLAAAEGGPPSAAGIDALQAELAGAWGAAGLPGSHGTVSVGPVPAPLASTIPSGAVFTPRPLRPDEPALVLVPPDRAAVDDGFALFLAHRRDADFQLWHADGDQLAGNAQFFAQRKRHPGGLLAIAQGGVVDGDPRRGLHGWPPGNQGRRRAPPD